MNKPDIKKLTKVNDEWQETKTQWIRVQTYNKIMGQGKAFTKEQYKELEQMFKASEERMIERMDSRFDTVLKHLENSQKLNDKKFDLIFERLEKNDQKIDQILQTLARNRIK